MKWVLYVIAAIVFAGVFVSIIGIVADADRLTFWTQTLMLSLLGTIIVAPALVYVAARSKSRTQKPSDTPPVADTSASSASPSAPRPTQSVLRITAYVFSALVVVWAAVSLISLFVDQSRLSFWTQSVMWSLLVLLVWAPVMAFFINPFNDPALQNASPETTRPDESTRDFIPERSTSIASDSGATEAQDTGAADTRPSRPTPSSAVQHEPDTGQNPAEEAGA